MSSQHPHGELVNENVHHEESDINVRAIITFVVVLGAITIAIQIAMVGLFKLFNTIENKTEPVVSPLTAGPAQVADFPSPSLQTTPWTDLEKLRASEYDYLHGYGWVDESGGIARIPIDKAKALLLQKGLPVRPDATNDPAEGTHVASTGQSNGGRTLPGGLADTSTTGGAAPSPGASPVPATPGGQAGVGAGTNAPPSTQPNPSVGQAASAPAAKKPAGGGATKQKKPGGGGAAPEPPAAGSVQ